MGIFTRLRDIINSNLNTMLEKAEDPEKLIRLMIQEMEDTLVEIKAQCASAMAQSKTYSRQADEAGRRAEEWATKARLAMEKDRDDLAREALREKKRYDDRANLLAGQKLETDGVVDQYQKDIQQLEEKIASAREKQKILVQRHTHAQSKRRAQEQIRKADTSEAFARFEGFERRVDRMEAEADLVNYGRKPRLEEQIEDLQGNEELEKELESLRKQVKGE
ncbi:phage shock protein PspA [bacterium]|nr:phage shock protein PspA [bacterium]